MSIYKLAPVGDAAILVSFETPDLLVSNRRVLALQHALTEARPPGLLDLTPAYHTLLVAYDPLRLPPAAAAETIHAAVGRMDETHTQAGRVVEVPVWYGGAAGPDLADVARHTGLSEAEVIQRHASGVYTVMFVGFMPGFPYLHGLDPDLATPRLASPRRQVPTGSVGIGGEQTGIYPSPLPGGWRLIGRTDVRLYDPHHDPPVLLRAGDIVHFVAI